MREVSSELLSVNVFFYNAIQLNAFYTFSLGANAKEIKRQDIFSLSRKEVSSSLYSLLRTVMTIQPSDIWICLFSFRFLDQNLQQSDQYKSESLDSREKKLVAKIERRIYEAYPFIGHRKLACFCSRGTVFFLFRVPAVAPFSNHPRRRVSPPSQPPRFVPDSVIQSSSRRPLRSRAHKRNPRGRCWNSLYITYIHTCG